MAVTLMPSAVQAQGRDGGIDASVVAGFMNIWYPELGYGGWTLAGAVRVPVSPLLSVEPEVIVTRHAKDQSFGGGSSAQAETRSRRTNRSGGVNLILTKRQGRIRPFGGGGIGIYGESFVRNVTAHRSSARRA
jgi:hypothetical protein